MANSKDGVVRLSVARTATQVTAIHEFAPIAKQALRPVMELLGLRTLV
jgi:hypothetical protein